MHFNVIDDVWQNQVQEYLFFPSYILGLLVIKLYSGQLLAPLRSNMTSHPSPEPQTAQNSHPSPECSDCIDLPAVRSHMLVSLDIRTVEFVSPPTCAGGCDLATHAPISPDTNRSAHFWLKVGNFGAVPPIWGSFAPKLPLWSRWPHQVAPR